MSDFHLEPCPKCKRTDWMMPASPQALPGHTLDPKAVTVMCASCGHTTTVGEVCGPVELSLPAKAERLSIEPNPGENYEGRQWGYTIMLDGRPYLRVTTGGTGSCWNLMDPEDEDDELHICELDDLIAALQFLRDSEAHKEHVKRWS